MGDVITRAIPGGIEDATDVVSLYANESSNVDAVEVRGKGENYLFMGR